MKSFITYLIESSILTESYKNAEVLFSRDNDAETVAETLKKFKELVAANRVKPEFKDITKWMKRPFDELDEFVRQLEATPSGKKSKKEAKGNSITITAFGDWIAIIPLSKGASCFYGKGTEWCTAATKSDNYFDSYFDRGITLVYFINKKDGTRYAVAMGKQDQNGFSNAEYFDERDNSITHAELAKELGINQHDLSNILHQAIEHEVVGKTHQDRKYAKLRDYVEEILNYKDIPDYQAYDVYSKIQDVLNKPNTLAAVGQEKIDQLKIKEKEYYKKYVLERVDNAMKELEYIKPLMQAGKQGSFYSRGDLRDFQRLIDRLPEIAQKIAPEQMKQLFAAYKESNHILETPNNQPSSQEKQDDELLSKLYS